MEENRKNLLIEQSKKIGDVIKVLTENFETSDVADEISYLNIVKSNLESWATKS